jgi:hypothetical protein
MSVSRVNKTADSFSQGNENKVAAHAGKTLPAVHALQAKAVQAPVKSGEAAIQKKAADIGMERFPGLESLPDSPSKLALTKELNQKGETTQNADPDKSKALLVEAKAQAAHKLIEDAINRSADTIVLNAELQKIKEELGLVSIAMVELGTDNAAVKFQVNPWYTHPISLGKVIYRMIGTHSTPITDVTWETDSLAIGGVSSTVGKHMIAKPLAPDHEPGSLSTVDTEQTPMMHRLPNAGNTGVPNDEKYIKGHLLNDHVGGPGESLNLFPITADANSNHLVFVEKFVKAQLNEQYVISYELRVENVAVKQIPSTTDEYVDADFNFYWATLDTSLQPINKHQHTIQSRFNTQGTKPCDIKSEYSGEYDKLNGAKSTPGVIAQPGQWQETGLTSPDLTSSKISPTLSAFSLHTGIFGGGGGSLSSGPPPPDYTANHIKQDTTTGLDFVSTRKLPSGINKGDKILVHTGLVTVNDITNNGGGWIRIYFK